MPRNSTTNAAAISDDTVRADEVTSGGAIVLWAALISIVALSTDMMLPALGVIATDLGLADPTDAGAVVTVLFAGFAIGQLVVGPLSDAIGRRPAVLGSLAVFALGCVVSLVAQDFTTLLVGRALQGLGAAGPRIVVMAIVRDGQSGPRLARTLSVVMAVFILVPAVAPLAGQGVLLLGDWRAMFAVLFALGLATAVWFAVGQIETHPPARRTRMSIGTVAGGIVQVMRNRTALAYTLALTGVFGPFIGYLGTAQHLFQNVYETGVLFPVYFGAAALAVGATSLVNARLVERWGTERLVRYALVALAGISAILAAMCLVAGLPSFGAFMVWLVGTFACIGFLFGNLNALAIEPLADRAGLASAVIGSVSTLIGLPVAWAVGELTADDPFVLAVGFMIGAVAALLAAARSTPNSA